MDKRQKISIISNKKITLLNLQKKRIFKSDYREVNMTWYTPKVAEVAVGLEINSYACAEV